jgi:hypothetical protein
MNEPLPPQMDRDINPDPITGERGAHPVATGVGAAGAGMAGAALGAVAGPVGSAIGAVVGAVAGGLGGHAVGEAIDPSVEDAYWRESHMRQPYAGPEDRFEDYQPAYRAGYEGFREHAGHVRSFDEAEPELSRRYQESGPKLGWDKAKSAARNAWNRVQNSAGSRTNLSQ